MNKLSFKKSTAAFIAALMLIAIAMPMLSLATAAPTSNAASGSVGDKVTVTGTGAQAGALVSIYMDNTAPENLLKTGYATGDGSTLSI